LNIILFEDFKFSTFFVEKFKLIDKNFECRIIKIKGPNSKSFTISKLTNHTSLELKKKIPFERLFSVLILRQRFVFHKQSWANYLPTIILNDVRQIFRFRFLRATFSRSKWTRPLKKSLIPFIEIKIFEGSFGFSCWLLLVRKWKRQISSNLKNQLF